MPFNETLAGQLYNMVSNDRTRHCHEIFFIMIWNRIIGVYLQNLCQRISLFPAEVYVIDTDMPMPDRSEHYNKELKACFFSRSTIMIIMLVMIIPSFNVSSTGYFEANRALWVPLNCVLSWLPDHAYFVEFGQDLSCTLSYFHRWS